MTISDILDSDAQDVRLMNYGPIVGEYHRDAMFGPRNNKLGQYDVAASPDTGYQLDDILDVGDGTYRRVADWSYRRPGVPTSHTIELRDRLADGRTTAKRATISGILGEPPNSTPPADNPDPVTISDILNLKAAQSGPSRADNIPSLPTQVVSPPDRTPYSENELLNNMVEGVLGPKDKPSWIKRAYDQLSEGQNKEALDTLNKAYLEGALRAENMETKYRPTAAEVGRALVEGAGQYANAAVNVGLGKSGIQLPMPYQDVSTTPGATPEQVAKFLRVEAMPGANIGKSIMSDETARKLDEAIGGRTEGREWLEKTTNLLGEKLAPTTSLSSIGYIVSLVKNPAALDAFMAEQAANAPDNYVRLKDSAEKHGVTSPEFVSEIAATGVNYLPFLHQGPRLRAAAEYYSPEVPWQPGMEPRIETPRAEPTSPAVASEAVQPPPIPPQYANPPIPVPVRPESVKTMREADAQARMDAINDFLRRREQQAAPEVPPELLSRPSTTTDITRDALAWRDNLLAEQSNLIRNAGVAQQITGGVPSVISDRLAAIDQELRAGYQPPRPEAGPEMVRDKSIEDINAALTGPNRPVENLSELQATGQLRTPPARAPQPLLAGLENIPQPSELARTVVEQTRANGGITINLSGRQPKSGFAFATTLATESRIPLDKFNEQFVDDFKAKHFDDLRKPGAHLGSWVDNQTGEAVLDISRVVSDKEAALRQATAGQQKAIYDIGRGEEIPVAQAPAPVAGQAENVSRPVQAGATGNGEAVQPSGVSGVQGEIGLANAVREPLRGAAGLQQAQKVIRQSMGESAAIAAKKEAQFPGFSSRMVERAAKKPVALDAVGQSAVLNELAKSHVDFYEAVRQSNENPGDAALKDAADAARENYQRAHVAADNAGTGTGRGLAFRKYLRSLDWSRPSMEARYRQAVNNGGPLSPEQMKFLDGIEQRIKDADAKLGDEGTKFLSGVDPEALKKLPPIALRNPEVIETAAVRHTQTGRIYKAEAGAPHYTIQAPGYLGPEGHRLYEEGFLNRSGDFRDREQAFRDMQRVGQLPEGYQPEYAGEANVTALNKAKFMAGLDPEAAKKILGKVYPYIHPELRDIIKSEAGAEQIVSIFDRLKPEMSAEDALKGEFLKDWYPQFKALLDPEFPNRSDAIRFDKVFGSYGANTPPLENTIRALKTWNLWEERGRPTNRNAIDKILEDVVITGEGKEAGKKADSILAWRNNITRSLATKDPREVVLSGPKVNPYARNKGGDLGIATLDRHEGIPYALQMGIPLSDAMPKGSQIFGFRKVGQDSVGSIGGHGYPGIAFDASLRRAAEILQDQTKQPWEVANVQAAQWGHWQPYKILGNEMFSRRFTGVDKLAKGEIPYSKERLKELQDAIQPGNIIRHEEVQAELQRLRGRRGALQEAGADTRGVGQAPQAQQGTRFLSGVDPEAAKKLAKSIKLIKQDTADLEARTAAKDTSPRRPAREILMSDEKARALYDREKAKADYQQMIARELHKQRPLIVRAGSFAASVPRRLAVAGHGIVFPVTHAGDLILNPLKWGTFSKGFLRTYGATFNKSFHDKIMGKMMADDLFPLAHAGKLDVGLETGASIHGAGLIKNTGPAARAWDALKVMRFELWKNQMKRYLRKNPDMTYAEKLDLAQNLATWANHATGSGKGALASFGKHYLFGPKLTQSKLNRLVFDPAKTLSTFANWNNATIGERAAAMTRLKGLTSYATTLFGFLAANQAYLTASGSDQKINFADWSKGDLWAFKVAGTDIAIPGITTELKYLARIIALYGAEKKEVQKNYRTSSKQSALFDIGKRYARSKASPAVNQILDIYSGEDYRGRPAPWSSEEGTKKYPKYKPLEYLISRGPIPTTGPAKYVYDQMREQGMSAADAAGTVQALMILGLGVTGLHLHEDYDLR